MKCKDTKSTLYVLHCLTISDAYVSEAVHPLTKCKQSNNIFGRDKIKIIGGKHSHVGFSPCSALISLAAVTKAKRKPSERTMSGFLHCSTLDFIGMMGCNEVAKEW